LKNAPEDLGFMQQSMLKEQRAMIEHDYKKVINLRIVVAMN
jgi:hypothetical protein